MFSDKIINGESGVLLYGITPPKSSNSPEKIEEITLKTINRIKQLEIDGLVIYDIQDEASRNASERPFPFISTVDAHTYSSVYLKELDLPKIVYCSVGKLSEDQLSANLMDSSPDNASVFVGMPSKGLPVKMTLSQAYTIWNQISRQNLLGAVAIPERHYLKKNEHLKIASKLENGCSFFITQCVYNVNNVKNLVTDLHDWSKETGTKLPTLIFTLTPCGSLKTLKFINWLGIHVPEWLANELSNCNNILEKSVDTCLKIASQIMDFCMEKEVPFGLNIESVSIKKDEIEASENLLKSVAKLLEEKGIRPIEE